MGRVARTGHTAGPDHSPHARLLEKASISEPFAPGHGLASTAAAAHGGAGCLSPSPLSLCVPLEGKAACLGMLFPSW